MQLGTRIDISLQISLVLSPPAHHHHDFVDDDNDDGHDDDDDGDLHIHLLPIIIMMNLWMTMILRAERLRLNVCMMMPFFAAKF